MTSHVRRGAVVLAFLAGVGAVSAAGAGWLKLSDRLYLTSAQERVLWQTIGRQNASTKAPPGFIASIGAVVPGSVTLHAMPSNAVSRIPTTEPFRYTILDEHLLIVNPDDRKVVEIITE
jgi:hypothetical protein